MTPLWIGLGAVAFLLLAFGVSYNRFVLQRNLIRESWSDIDTELRRRYDLIPNLVEAVRGYAAHERQIMEQVTQARGAALAQTGTPPEQAKTENALVAALRGLLAIAENYPALKAGENFLALQKELAVTEDRIQTARRLYNANVRDFNRRCQSIPSSFIAGLFGFRPAAFFEIEEAVRSAPQATFGT